MGSVVRVIFSNNLKDSDLRIVFWLIEEFFSFQFYTFFIFDVRNVFVKFFGKKGYGYSIWYIFIFKFVFSSNVFKSFVLCIGSLENLGFFLISYLEGKV